MTTASQTPLPDSTHLAGWREVVSVPTLNISDVVAKLDSGARTSALHATDIETIGGPDSKRIRFRVYDKHGDKLTSREVEADFVDVRLVRSSTGVTTNRYVIRETITIGQLSMAVEITLTDRGKLRYPMLLGRATMTQFGLHIDPKRSWRLTRRPG